MTKNFEAPTETGFKIRFHGASLTESSQHAGKLPRFKIGWYIKGADIDTASTRYRCYHFARILDREFESAFLINHKDIKENIHNLDAIIIVKRLDRTTLDVAALARHYNKPLFLDLCDDVANFLYPSRDDPYLALTSLLALAPILKGIVVPSAEMATRIEGYLRDNGLSGNLCHVIPDIAETREIHTKTEQFLRRVQAVPGAPVDKESTSDEDQEHLEDEAIANANLLRIIWFGNFGGSHSNFGMFSLKPRLRKLRGFHRTYPIELVIVSNSFTVYQALVAGCGFPTRYVSWSPSAVYDELERADAALLTTGNDDFCTVKSSNRVLQALAASVPVIADKSPALAELEDVIFARPIDCLGPDRENVVAQRMARARIVLQRYTPERLGAQWAMLLRRAIGETLTRRSEASRHGVLLLLDIDDEPENVIHAIDAINQTSGLDCDLLVSTGLLNEDQSFNRIIHRSQSLPMFFSGKLGNIEAQLSRRSAVCIGNPESDNGKLVCNLANQLGLKVLTHADLPSCELNPFAKQSLCVKSATEAKLHGASPQRTDLSGTLDWAFVIDDKATGWILEAICREIGSRQTGSWQIVSHTSFLPAARNIFFSHVSLLDRFYTNSPEGIAGSNFFVWYTHPREETQETIARNLDLFSRTTRVIFTCTSNRQTWIDRGLEPTKAVVVLGAADPLLFRPHQRSGGAVGLSSSFYERKNPDFLLNVVKALPHRNFVLLGRNWNRYARFEELKALPNFTYLTRPYSDYPQIYSTFDVFLSISSLEGGPIPLVEAMMCNAVPVASRTGFAPDLIEAGHNGFLFDIEEGEYRVCQLIEQAFELDTDVRKTVEDYSWDRFSAEIVSLVP